ncbi:MAG TPA: hypothetical protein VGR90_10675 [Acidimicrobiales bacterium]|nr:hypothetical protein [Acidimicrobiales bacterium]
MADDVADAVRAAAEPFSEALVHVQRGMLELVTAVRLGLDAIEAIIHEASAAEPRRVRTVDGDGDGEGDRDGDGRTGDAGAESGPPSGTRVERIRLS